MMPCLILTCSCVPLEAYRHRNCKPDPHRIMPHHRQLCLDLRLPLPLTIAELRLSTTSNLEQDQDFERL